MDISTVLDWISKIANFGLFIVACIGLNQLKIAKKDIQVRSEREAITLTGEICTKFGNETLDLFSKILDKISESEYKSEIKKITHKADKELQDNEICKGYLKRNNEWFKLVTMYNKVALFDELSSLANQLEGFSIYFTKGVANEEIAFAPMGESFCNMCNYIIPMIAITRCTACGECSDFYKKHSYENLIELYKIWSSKIKNEKLSSEMKRLTHELNKNKTDNQVNVIGTK